MSFEWDEDAHDTELSAEYPPERARGYTEDTGWWVVLWIVALWGCALWGLIDVCYRIWEWAHQ
jgi:hypothetical protein